MNRRAAHRSRQRHSAPQEFLVGRRARMGRGARRARGHGSDGFARKAWPELYLVNNTGVERLCPHSGFGHGRLDWRVRERGAMELGYLVLSRIAGAAPSASLVQQFVSDVLAPLPAVGFVLDMAEVRGWLELAASDKSWPSAELDARLTWIRRFGHRFHIHREKPKPLGDSDAWRAGGRA